MPEGPTPSLVADAVTRDGTVVKYVLAGLAVVAAVAALFFRPPTGAPGSSGIAANGKRDAGSATDPAALVPEPVSESSPGNRNRVGSSGGLGGSHAGRRTPPGQRIIVYVAGEVVRPGVYELAAGSRAQAALALAGGAKADADLVAVNLAAPLDDGIEIAVPAIGAAARPDRRRASSPRRRNGRTPRTHGRHARESSAAPQAASIDLNSADEGQLQAIPGIGPALATRIVTYRDSNGPFASVDELADVSGITPRLQDVLAAFVFVR